MRKRSSRKQGPEDLNEIAFRVVNAATGQEESPVEPEKNPAAVALGSLGGKVGGKARAASMSPERRSEIARQAALSRWHRDT
jgi:hypothetical protein